MEPGFIFKNRAASRRLSSSFLGKGACNWLRPARSSFSRVRSVDFAAQSGITEQRAPQMDFPWVVLILGLRVCDNRSFSLGMAADMYDIVSMPAFHSLDMQDRIFQLSRSWDGPWNHSWSSFSGTGNAKLRPQHRESQAKGT